LNVLVSISAWFPARTRIERSWVTQRKESAAGIDEYLRKNKHPETIIKVEILKRHSTPPDYLDINRQAVPIKN